MTANRYGVLFMALRGNDHLCACSNEQINALYSLCQVFSGSMGHKINLLTRLDSLLLVFFCMKFRLKLSFFSLFSLAVMYSTVVQLIVQERHSRKCLNVNRQTRLLVVNGSF